MDAVEFVRTVARLTKDGECPNCLKRGDNPECEESGDEGHYEFEMTIDDAYETLHTLIDDAREILALSAEPEVQRAASDS